MKNDLPTNEADAVTQAIQNGIKTRSFPIRVQKWMKDAYDALQTGKATPEQKTIREKHRWAMARAKSQGRKQNRD